MKKGKRSRKQMAKVKKNMMLSGLSGSLGPDHYAHVTKDGRTIISLKPDFSNRQFSEPQIQSRVCEGGLQRKPSAPHRGAARNPRRAENLNV
jgi:hypothetical protein